jgi:hypothetical protein
LDEIIRPHRTWLATFNLAQPGRDQRMSSAPSHGSAAAAA